MYDGLVALQGRITENVNRLFPPLCWQVQNTAYFTYKKKLNSKLTKRIINQFFQTTFV